MSVNVKNQLVKALRKQVCEFGFRQVLLALAAVAWEVPEGSATAAWCFLSYKLRNLAKDDLLR